jgi:Replication Fork Protection Component Swi3
MQVGDLQRLLELYQGWQQQILPDLAFDDFISQLERIGAKKVVKVRYLSLKLVRLLLIGLQHCFPGHIVVSSSISLPLYEPSS